MPRRAHAARLAVALDDETRPRLSEAALNCVIFELARRNLHAPNLEIVRMLVAQDPRVERALLTDYAEVSGFEGGLDQDLSQRVFDLLARHYSGRSWPAGDDTLAERQRFLAKMREGLDCDGWRHDLAMMTPTAA